MVDQPQPPQTPAPAPQMDRDQFYNTYKPTLDRDAFFNKYAPTTSQGPDLASPFSDFLSSGPYSGDLSDALFSQGSLGRIAHSFGEHFQEGWDGTQGSFYKSELDKEAKEKDAGLLTGLRNAFAKPVTAGMDALMKLPYAIGGGIAGLTGQTGEELRTASRKVQEAAPGPVGTILGAPAGALGELAGEVSEGAGLEGGIPEAATVRQGIVRDQLQELQKMRSEGQIGEGEAGFFKVTPPTPDQIAQREAAAKEAGLRVGPPTLQEWKDNTQYLSGPDMVPNVDQLAREMNPDLYKQIDDLRNLKENLQMSIQQELRKAQDETSRLAEQQGVPEDQVKASPDLKKALGNVQELQRRAQEADEGIRDTFEDRANTRARVEALMKSDTPEGEAYRKYVQAKAFEEALKFEEVKPRVEEQLRLANDLVDSTKSIEPTKTTSAPKKEEKSGYKYVKQAPEVKIDPVAVQGHSLRAVKGTGEKKPLIVNQRLQLDSVIKGWTQDMGDVPETATMQVRQQVSDAIQFVDQNESLAKRIAMGEAEVPEDVNVYPEAVLRVLKDRAEKEGDVELGMKLAETKLAVEARTMGQRLNLLRGMYDIDPVGIIQDLNHLKDETLKKKIQKIIGDIKDSADQAMKTFKPDIESFINSIECE